MRSVRRTINERRGSPVRLALATHPLLDRYWLRSASDGGPVRVSRSLNSNPDLSAHCSLFARRPLRPPPPRRAECARAIRRRRKGWPGRRAGRLPSRAGHLRPAAMPLPRLQSSALARAPEPGLTSQGRPLQPLQPMRRFRFAWVPFSAIQRQRDCRESANCETHTWRKRLPAFRGRWRSRRAPSCRCPARPRRRPDSRPRATDTASRWPGD